MQASTAKRLRLAGYVLAWTAGILVTLALITGGIAIVVLTGQTGRDLAVNAAEGRQIGGYGTLSVSGLEGNLFDRVSVRRLTLTDEEGVWLEVENVVLDWSPASLLAGELDIAELSAQRVNVLRRPVTVETEAGGGGIPDIGLAIDRFEVSTLALAEGVAGEAAEIAITGEAQGRGTRWAIEAQADRIDAPGDRLALIIRTDGDIDIRADLDAEPGGPLANLLRAPEEGLNARLDVSGTPDAGEGRFELFVGETRAGSSTLDWEDRMLNAQGRFSASAWRDFEQVESLTGGPLDFTIALPLGSRGVTQPQLDALTGEINAPRLTLSAARQPEGIALQVREAAGLVNALLPETLQFQSIAADGVLRPSEGENPLVFEGRVAASGITLPIGTAEQLAGPVRVEGPFSEPSVTSALQARGLALDAEALQSLAGDTPLLESTLVWNNEARTLEIESARLSGAEGLQLTGTGLVDVDAGRVTASLRHDRLAIERLTDQLSGRVTGSGELDFSFDGSGTIAASGTASNLGGELGQRIGGDARYSARLVRDRDGALSFEAIEISSPNLAAEAQGRVGEAGWTLSGQAAWSGGAPLAAMVLEGTASLAFEASDENGRFSIRADARAPSAGAGPVVVDDARLRLEGEGPPDAFEGRWLLTGQAATGPVDIGGNASRTGERAELTGIEGRFGGFNFTGGLVAEGETIAGDLGAVPVNGFGSAEIAFRVADGALNARIRAEDMVGEDLTYLDALAFDASGPFDAITYSLTAEGAYGARAQLSANGRFTSGEDGGELTLALDGRYGGVPIATRQPASVQFGNDRLSGQLALSLGDGRLDLRLDQQGETIEADLDASAIPAMLLSYPSGREPVTGALSGEARLTRTGGAWQGTAELSADRLSPPEGQVPDGSDIAVNALITARLDGTGLRIDASADGSGLDASADLQWLSGPVTGAGSLTASETGLAGEARVQGEIATLAAFRLAEGQSLSGAAQVNARLGGTVGAPDFGGSLALNGARFDDPALGISVRDLTLNARFARDRLEIESLTASSADGGELSGSGTLSLADARITGRSELEFSDFLIVERPELTAVGGGNIVINIEQNRIEVSGETRLARAEVRPPEASRPAIATVEVSHVNAAGARAEMAPMRQGPDIVLNYRIYAPGRIFVRGPQFDSEWSMDVTARGLMDAVRLSGRATLLRGRADLLGRPFEMRSGSIVFAGNPMDAAINLVAERQARDITAEIRVGGRVSSPEITLASNPSLPQDEIASRLLFDQGAGQLSGIQAAQLAGAVASLSSGGGFDPFGALRSGLGLDQLAVSSTATGETVVAGGRYLTEDVYLEVESGGGSAAASTRIEWALTQNVTLLSRIAPDGESGVALTWRREYD